MVIALIIVSILGVCFLISGIANWKENTLLKENLEEMRKKLEENPQTHYPVFSYTEVNMPITISMCTGYEDDEEDDEENEHIHTETSTTIPETIHQRCDECFYAKATHVAIKQKFTLYLCTHHMEKNYEGLKGNDWDIFNIS